MVQADLNQLFNTLQFDLMDKNFVEVFAGSGSIGFEALSRGANYALFFEGDKLIANAIKKNIALFNIEKKASVFIWDITKNLNCLKKQNLLFDFVFVDPPYHKDFLTPSLNNLKKTKVLKKGALLLVEHSIKESIPENIFPLYERRKYGSSYISFLIANE